MNKLSKFTKGKWANGQPSIEINPYDYSRYGFEKILSTLNKYFAFEALAPIVVLDKIMTSIIINNEKIEVDMDNWTCSLAFESESLRGKVFDLLKERV